MKRNPPPGNVRRVHSNGRNITYTLTSKIGDTIQGESFEESKLVLLMLERDKTVVSCRSQPETLHYLDSEGVHRRYTPDFLVERIDGSSELHEVTRRRNKTPELAERERAGKRICAARGWRYIVHTPETLPQGTYLANLQMVRGFAAFAHNVPSLGEVVVNADFLSKPISITEVISRFAESLSIPETNISSGILHLVWHCVLDLSWDVLLLKYNRLNPIVHVWRA